MKGCDEVRPLPGPRRHFEATALLLCTVELEQQPAIERNRIPRPSQHYDHVSDISNAATGSIAALSLKVCWLIVKTSNHIMMLSRQLKKWLNRVSTTSRKRQLTAKDTNTSAFFPSRYAGCWMVRNRSTYEHCSRSVIGLTIFWQTSRLSTLRTPGGLRALR